MGFVHLDTFRLINLLGDVDINRAGVNANCFTVCFPSILIVHQIMIPTQIRKHHPIFNRCKILILNQFGFGWSRTQRGEFSRDVSVFG